MLRNQHGQWLDRSLQWADHCPPGQRFKTPHRDVALNQLVEVNARDISLRCTVESLQQDAPEALEETVAASAD